MKKCPEISGSIPRNAYFQLNCGDWRVNKIRICIHYDCIWHQNDIFSLMRWSRDSVIVFKLCIYVAGELQNSMRGWLHDLEASSCEGAPAAWSRWSAGNRWEDGGRRQRFCAVCCIIVGHAPLGWYCLTVWPFWESLHSHMYIALYLSNWFISVYAELLRWIQIEDLLK